MVTGIAPCMLALYKWSNGIPLSVIDCSLCIALLRLCGGNRVGASTFRAQSTEQSGQSHTDSAALPSIQPTRSDHRARCAAVVRGWHDSRSPTASGRTACTVADLTRTRERHSDQSEERCVDSATASSVVHSRCVHPLSSVPAAHRRSALPGALAFGRVCQTPLPHSSSPKMSAPSTVRLSELNSMSASEFTRALHGIYESSPWIPESVATQRPFASLAALAAAMAKVVKDAPPAKQMALIRAHPKLALKNPADTANLTDNSRMEQTRAGLTTLTDDVRVQFDKYTAQYAERHGFPFIVAVLSLDRDALVRQFGERVFNTTEVEVRRALAEIDRIAWLRLQRTVVDDGAAATPSTLGSLSPESAPLGATRSSVGTRVVDCQYGKSRVRVLKVLRDSPVHSVCEVEVQVLLRGAIVSSFTRGDNGLVVPTDTCKNTILVLARQSLTDSVEEFLMKVGAHFLAQYPHLSSVDLQATEKVWERLSVASESSPGIFNGPPQPHPHTFQLRGPQRSTVHVVATRQSGGSCWVQSGIADLTVMKSTGSGFANFPRGDGMTLLAETDDRIMATKVAAQWVWSSVPSCGFRAANARLLEWMTNRFARAYSVSVQATEYEMCLDALAAVPEIARIKIRLPNVHFLPYDLRPFQLPNEGKVFVPTDEPHGTIEVEVSRDNLVGDSRKLTEGEEKVLGQFKGSKPCAPLPPRPKL